MGAAEYSIDIGPNLATVLVPIAMGIASWLGAKLATRNQAKELKPNGGSSLRDSVDALHRRLDEQGAPSGYVDRFPPPSIEQPRS